MHTKPLPFPSAHHYPFLIWMVVAIGMFGGVYLLVTILTQVVTSSEQSQTEAAPVMVDTSDGRILSSLEDSPAEIEGEEEFGFNWLSPPRVYTRILQPADANANGIARRKIWLGLGVDAHRPDDASPGVFFRIVKEVAKGNSGKTAAPGLYFRLNDISAFSAALGKFAEWERLAKEHAFRVEDKPLFETPPLLAFFSADEKELQARLKIVLIRSDASREVLIFDSGSVSKIIRLCEKGSWRKECQDAEAAAQKQKEEFERRKKEKEEVEHLLK